MARSVEVNVIAGTILICAGFSFSGSRNLCEKNEPLILNIKMQFKDTSNFPNQYASEI